MTALLPFLVHLVGLRDPHGAIHSDHVTTLASDLGQAVGLDAKELDLVEFAATVHDIGKIAINDFVINKPGKFTEAEYIMVQQHARIGAVLMDTLELDQTEQAAVIFRSVHASFGLWTPMMH
jgi:HD-GYP domain-containing protein (c-di-GMP phosphodiesterase class II)